MTLDEKIDSVIAELRVLNLEMRAGFAESRARDAEQSTRLTTLLDSIADVRVDLFGHTHEPLEEQ